jgi:mannose-6-phosphate isomerase-like protein (cupin superfamily)
MKNAISWNHQTQRKIRSFPLLVPVYCLERYYILSGSGRVEIGDLAAERVAEGDVVIIPPMSRQRITNTGSSDLVFLALCTPRFSQEDYEDLEVQ